MCHAAHQLINLRKSFPDNYSLFLASHNISGSIIGGVLFTRSLHDFGIIGKHLQTKKAALPYPSTPSSIKEYYGLKRWAAKFLTSKEFTIPASLIKAGWAFPTSSAPLAATKSIIQAVIPNSDYLYDLQSNFS